MKTKLNKVFKYGWQNFKRNSYLSMGTTGVFALTLILFTGLLTFNFLSSSIVSDLENKVDVTAYFIDEASEEDILALKTDIEGLATVRSVNYVSKDEALDRFKERHADDELIQESLAELESNPLQASLNIKAQDPELYPNIVEYLEGNFLRSAIDKINFYENQGVIGRVQTISNGVERWGLIAMLILASIAILVAFNTIRLTIYSQRQEIEIMRLVGATNGQIRGPYIVEGGLYGFFGGLIALGIFYPTLSLVSPRVSSFAPNIDLFGYFGLYAPQFIVMVIGLGIFLGVISSYIAIRRYLNI